MEKHSDIKQEMKEVVRDTLMKIGLVPLKIVLFGSRARGDLYASDWDILIVVDGEVESKKTVWYEVYRALHRKFKGESFDVILKSYSEFMVEKQIVNTVANESELEGEEL